ncbi:MAG: hypothetical protein OEV35_06905, partial [Gallionellaceae bacterium]|nr:hypothetical protein [Gallionellaceae bacterium]
CAEHMGGTGHRNIFFDIWSGHVWVRHQPFPADGKPDGGSQLSGEYAADKEATGFKPGCGMKAQPQTMRPANRQQGKTLCPQ